MSWKEQAVVKILLLVAKFMSQEEWKRDIENLSNHILHGKHD